MAKYLWDVGYTQEESREAHGEACSAAPAWHGTTAHTIRYLMELVVANLTVRFE